MRHAADELNAPVRIHPRVAWQAVGGEVVVVDLRTGRALGLNRAGSFLWPQLEARTTDELAVALASSFGVGAAQALSDVRAFLGTLKERDLIVAA